MSLRYRMQGDPGALSDAIDVFRNAVRGADPADFDLPACLNNLGNALADWYQLTRSPAALTEAEDCFRQAVNGLPGEDPRLATFLTGLSDALLSRYTASGSLSDLDGAIGEAERAVAAAREGDPLHPVCLNGLANALAERYKRAGDLGALDRAERVLRHAASEADIGASDRALVLNGLGNLLQQRFEADRDLGALAEAERLLAECVAITPPDDPARGGYLNNLGGVRWSRYRQSGDLRAQRESADTYRAAVAALPEGHDHYPLSLGNLASALIDRYESAGDLAALNEGIAALRHAAELRPPPDPRCASYLSRLGSALLRRYERVGREADLAEAEEASRRAVLVTPAGDILRPMLLSDLGIILHRRYRDDQDPDAIDDAEAGLREALASTTDGAPGRLLLLSNLGNVLCEQYTRSPRLAVLDEAIDLLRQAERSAPHGDVHRSVILGNLGEALRLRYGTDPQPAVLAEAVKAFSEAAVTSTASPHQRANAAQVLAGLTASAGNWRQAADAYQLAIELLPAVASQELDRSDKEHGLADFTTIASNAAAAALQCGNAHQAISLLESGRGVLFAQTLQLRTPLDGLAAVSPSLANRFQQLSHQLGAEATGFSPDAAPSPHGPAVSIIGQIAVRQRIVQKWNDTLTEIRTLPGLGDFLRLPTPQQLLDEAGTGPVAILNIGRYRSDALILSGGHIQVVPLPAAPPQAVGAKTIEFFQALDTITNEIAGQHEHEQAEETLAEVLDWLWDAVTGPVVRTIPAAGHAPGGTRQRLWWIPTGLLSLLPLHAAAKRTRTGIYPGQAVTDHFISSYAPTIRALGMAKEKRASTAHDHALVVAVPSAPGAMPLPEAQSEGEAVASQNRQATLLTGPSATRDRVLRELPLHEDFHFSGHAVGDLNDPSASALLLYDGLVTVRDISRLRLARANIAFLSACETAKSGVDLIDETINIASACQLAGFRHVIATLWPIKDHIAGRAAKQIWRELRNADADPALSVDRVAAELRRRYPRNPSIWAAYVHVGP